MQTETKNCQSCKKEFVIEPEDFQFYEKMQVPPPAWCPDCRMQRRMAFRNERKIFWATSGLSGKKVLTLYAPAFGYTIFDDDEWRTDAWDPLSYGREIDWSRPFLAQVGELARVVPKAAAARINMVNSEYSGNADGLKNCYLLFNSNHSEDCGYGNGVDFSANCWDNSHIQKCQLSYGSFWLTNCNKTHFSSRCEDCTDMWLSRDCTGCSDCFGCVNLRRKKYCIFNVQYSKEEYVDRLAAMNLSSMKGFMAVAEKAMEFWKTQPYKYMEGVQNLNVSGEFITHSKNVRKSYIIRAGEDIKYSQYMQVPTGKDIHDTSLLGQKAELFYECSVAGWDARNLKFCFECWGGTRDLEYCMLCQRSSNCFGCVDMRDGQYCILNKRYSKEEYEALIPRIKKHMDEMPYVDKLGRTYGYGEFFPAELSPVAYNHSIAPEHFPLSKEEALAAGFIWVDDENKEYEATRSAADLPDDVKDASDDLSREIISCSYCGKGFRIIPEEMRFLKRIGIPLPRKCADCRHADRIAQRNKAHFYSRPCDCAGRGSRRGPYDNTAGHPHGDAACPNAFETSYAPDRPEIVYCEQCYNAEVV